MYLHARNTLLVLMTLASVPTPSMARESVLKTGNGSTGKAERVAIDQEQREVWFVRSITG